LKREVIILLTLLVISLASITLMDSKVSAQPTWSFKFTAKPATLYPGEWGYVTLNITNMDCQSDLKISESVYELEDVHEDVLEKILARAEEMNRSRQIEGYEWITESMRGYGGDVYYTGELRLYGVCRGRAITIKKSYLWFPFKGTTRTYIFENSTEVTLQAFDREAYILEGSSNGSSALITFKVFVPPDIPPENFAAKPVIDIRVDYLGWREYTLEDLRISNAEEVVIQPYRTFNLTITDFDGLNPIAGAKVVISRLMHYYEKREYTTPENGTIRIHRLKEGDYEVRIYWNSTEYHQKQELVCLEQLSAYGLSKGILKTHVYNFEVNLLDLKDRKVDNATIILDGVQKRSINGRAVFQLVPEGNHSIEVQFKGLKLHDGWVWAGYHPTYHFRKPSTSISIKLNVSDLLVQVVDSAGRPVGATFTVEGPTAETTVPELYSPNGFLNISQLPIAEYKVRAYNYSKPFSKQIEGSGIFNPGQHNEITLPIYQVKLRILDAKGSPVEGALISLASLTAESDDGGLTVFEQVPEGVYNLTVRWMNVIVYSGDLSVDSAKEVDVKTSIYDIEIEMRDLDGYQKPAHYILSDPAGRRFEEEYSAYIRAEGVPDGRCLLEVLDPSKGWLILKTSYNCSSLASEKQLRLPLGSMKVKILTVDGRPLAFARVKIVFPEWNRTELLKADEFGEVEVPDAKLGTYHVEVVDSRALNKVYDGEVRFEGEPITIRTNPLVTRVQQTEGLGAYGSGGIGAVQILFLALPIAVLTACVLILRRGRRRLEQYSGGTRGA